MVLPYASGTIPSKIAAPESLNDIRKLHRVWITIDHEPNILDICSESISQLQQAIEAINQRIHDLRVSDKLVTSEIIVHKNPRVSEDARIQYKMTSRPSLVSRSTAPVDVAATTEALNQQLHPLLLRSTECLTSVTFELRMRVFFGKLQIQSTKKTLAEEITYQEFADVAEEYSVRGGLPLRIW